jgi:hypothetical protein
MHVLSFFIQVCIIGGVLALLYGLYYVLFSWTMLPVTPPWRPTIAAGVSAGAFLLAWVLRLVRERASD